MRLDIPNSGWIDCCENCLDRIFRAYGGVWIGIHEDEVSTNNLRCTDGNDHVPIGVDPPPDVRCPHGAFWQYCNQGCIGLDGEYIPLHGHEPLYKQEYLTVEEVIDGGLTTEEVSCFHCRQPIKPSAWREKRWFHDKNQNETGSHRCDKAPNGYHEPWSGMAATDNVNITRKKKEDA